MIEYFNKPDKTKDYFYIDINGEKWSQTGDIGYINNDGSLTVLGRKGDFSIINGVKIYNFDVESAILNSKYVKKCEVQTHPSDSNSLVAHIVLNEDIKFLLSESKISVNEIVQDVQNSVKEVAKKTNVLEMIPNLFCIKDDFPIAKLGKRDSLAIKNNIDGIIVFEEEKVNKLTLNNK